MDNQNFIEEFYLIQDKVDIPHLVRIRYPAFIAKVVPAYDIIEGNSIGCIVNEKPMKIVITSPIHEVSISKIDRTLKRAKRFVEYNLKNE